MYASFFAQQAIITQCVFVPDRMIQRAHSVADGKAHVSICVIEKVIIIHESAMRKVLEHLCKQPRDKAGTRG
jgi:hypothetical protein